MIISMRLHATKEEIDNVRARIEEFGYKVHSIAGEERVVIGAVGQWRRHAAWNRSKRCRASSAPCAFRRLTNL